MVKNPPAKQETWVQSLGLEDPPGEEMTTQSVFLPGKSHGQRSLVGYSYVVAKVRHDLATKHRIKVTSGLQFMTMCFLKAA